jgi:hypothetical protein
MNINHKQYIYHIRKKKSINQSQGKRNLKNSQTYKLEQYFNLQ